MSSVLSIPCFRRIVDQRREHFVNLASLLRIVVIENGTQRSKTVKLSILTNDRMQFSESYAKSTNIVKTKFVASFHYHLVLLHRIFARGKTNR